MLELGPLRVYQGVPSISPVMGLVFMMVKVVAAEVWPTPTAPKFQDSGVTQLMAVVPYAANASFSSPASFALRTPNSEKGIANVYSLCR